MRRLCSSDEAHTAGESVLRLLQRLQREVLAQQCAVGVLYELERERVDVCRKVERREHSAQLSEQRVNSRVHTGTRTRTDGALGGIDCNTTAWACGSRAYDGGGWSSAGARDTRVQSPL